MQELVSAPLGNLLYADRSTEDLEAPRKPVQRAEALLDSNFYSETVLNSKPVALGSRACVGLYVTCKFKVQTMKRSTTHIQRSSFLSYCQSCSESCFLLDCHVVSQRSETRNRGYKLS